MTNVETEHVNDQLDQQPGKFQEETNDQMKKLQEQMQTLTEKVEKSNKLMSSVQHEVTDVKNDTKSYKQSL